MLDIEKLSRQKVFEINRKKQLESHINVHINKVFVLDRQIFEIEGSGDQESPLYFLIQRCIFLCNHKSSFVLLHLSKIFERIMYNTVHLYFAKEQLHVAKPFGFCKNIASKGANLQLRNDINHGCIQDAFK